MTNVLNQWAKETEASDGGFAPHPLGDFPGVIVSIKQKHLDKKNQTIWNLNVKTAHGQGQYTIWGFTDQDISDANTRQESRDKLLATLGRYKRLFVDLGVWTKDEAKTAGWDEGPHSIVGAMNGLHGRACMLHVEANLENPKYQVVYINAPQDLGTEQSSSPASQSMGPSGLDQAPPFPEAPGPLAPPPGFG